LVDKVAELCVLVVRTSATYNSVLESVLVNSLHKQLEVESFLVVYVVAGDANVDDWVELSMVWKGLAEVADSEVERVLKVRNVIAY